MVFYNVGWLRNLYAFKKNHPPIYEHLNVYDSNKRTQPVKKEKNKQADIIVNKILGWYCRFKGSMAAGGKTENVQAFLLIKNLK